MFLAIALIAMIAFASLFVPMHFVASGFKSAWRMKEFTDARGIPFWSIQHNGEERNIES